MKRTMTVLGIFALAIVFAPATQAAPITYLYEGVGSGTLGSVVFSGVEFLITAQADTANITPWASALGGPQNTHLSTDIELSGFGTHTILTPSHSWVSGVNSLGGLGANLGANWITFNELPLVGYGLDVPFGPILEDTPGDVVQFNGVSTSGGELAFSDIRWATFTVIPEPATLSLLALSGLALIRRR